MSIFPSQTNFVTGDILTATAVNEIGQAINLLDGAQFSAGKNKIINGDFTINQRAFTSSTTSGTYGFDRWKQANSGGTVTYSAQTFTAGAAPVAGYEGTNFARIVTTGQSGAGDLGMLNQRIESVRTCAGQTVTISFWAKSASAGQKIAVEVAQIFGTTGSPSADVNTLFGQVTLTTSWARYSVTGTMPSVSGKTITTSDQLALNLWVSGGTTFNSRTGSLGIQSGTFDFWGVQFESANTASNFQTATGTLQGELAACQRYYWRSGGSQSLGVGYVGSTTTFDYLVNLPVPMRAAATFATNSGTSYFYLGVGGGSAGATNSNTFFNATNMNAVSRFTGTGFTVGQAGIVQTNNAAAYMEASAEL